MLTLAKSWPFSMRVSSVEPPPMSMSVPRSIARSQVAPTKPKWASSRAESNAMGMPMASCRAATASAEFSQLRSTAVANTSMRLQSKYRARFKWPLSTDAARSMPACTNVPFCT